MNKEKKRKIIIIAACAVTLLIFSFSVAYAWFSRQHRIARMQEVIPPNTIFLSAAHREAEINFQIGEVNTNASATHIDYVFSVSGQGIQNYVLKLAHTTNNPFTYYIYPADFQEYDSEDPPTGTNGVDYVLYTATGNHTEGSPNSISNDVSTGKTYCYTIKKVNDTAVDAVTGSYQNANGTVPPIIAQSSGTHHDATYSSGDMVQENAEPLYWKSTTISGESNSFCHNYILRIDWTGKTIDRTLKETDIIYLFASTANGSG